MPRWPQADGRSRDEPAVAEEAGDRLVGGMPPQPLRRCGLQHPARDHHGDPVGDGERLVVVVGDVQRGRPGPARGCRQVAAEPVAQRAVERRQRLVEQQQPGSGSERAGQRDPLLLTAGQRRDRPPARSRRARPGRAARRPGRPGRPAAAGHPQPEGDVAADVAVREQLPVLEHQPEAAPVHRHAGQVRAVPADRPASGGSSPATARSSVRLAAAGRAEQRDHLPGATSRLTPSTRGDVAAGARPPRLARRRAAAQQLGSRRRAPAAARRRRSPGGDHGEDTEAASAMPRLSLPGRPISRKIDHRQRRAVGPRQEARRAELAEADTAKRSRRRGRATGRASAGRRRANTRAGPAPSTRGRLAQPLVDRSQHGQHGPDTSGTATTACAIGTSTADERRSSGGRFSVIRKPKPTVTAETPSGSMNNPSSTPIAPRRGSAARPAREHHADQHSDQQRDPGGVDGDPQRVQRRLPDRSPRAHRRCPGVARLA